MKRKRALLKYPIPPVPSFSNATYPLDPGKQFEFLEVLVKKEEQLQRDGEGRIARSGVVRAIYGKEIHAPAGESITSNSVLGDAPRIYNRKRIKQLRKRGLTCGEKHPGLCIAKHDSSKKDVSCFCSPLMTHLQKRGTCSHVAGTQG